MAQRCQKRLQRAWGWRSGRSLAMAPHCSKYLFIDVGTFLAVDVYFLLGSDRILLEKYNFDASTNSKGEYDFYFIL